MLLEMLGRLCVPPVRPTCRRLVDLTSWNILQCAIHAPMIGRAATANRFYIVRVRRHDPPT